MDTILGAAAGLGVAVVGVPVVAGAIGFSAGGIVAGSLAAKMMSAAAIANGGGVAAGVWWPHCSQLVLQGSHLQLRLR
ncbi:hypothetical protein JD844_005337 [Phrynosoma platyrhinos]|uniref:Uncharacterized protein n=1 Tax=Phrynosoma platyrhinos TaxID=52577 RepID=A0ABQ7TNY3_PHRPL|nr:hypothetical protein JD844_005337 [Phrynosoma platyrhinos]